MNNASKTETETFETTLSKFVAALEAAVSAHYTKSNPSSVVKMSVDPGGKKFIRIVSTISGSRSVYCFVRREDGAILKPGSWKAPEPKHIVRGNINAGLDGCGPYGVAYVTGKNVRFDSAK